MSHSIRAWVLIAIAVVASRGVAAEEDCTRYVPSIGKTIHVPCEQATSPPAAPAATPAPVAPVAQPAIPELPVAPAIPDDDKGVGGLKRKIAKMTEVLNAARDDQDFRNTFCEFAANGKRYSEASSEEEKEWALSQNAELDRTMGERGRWAITAHDSEVMKKVFAVPTGDGLTMWETPEGKEFVKAQSAFRLTCNCMLEPRPPRRLSCCERCDEKAMKARAARDWTEPRAFSPDR